MSRERIVQTWIIQAYTFEAVEGHGFSFPAFPRVMYRFKINGQGNHEMYQSLDRAMVAAVGEKYTGPRSAGGGGVGTAADWFCVMVGMDHAEDGQYQQRTAEANQERAAEAHVLEQIDPIQPCPYTQSHTCQFCGHVGCRES